ncbi:hypothetical protein K2173_025120 [Erythroxylum novogranatense]|uniref:Uncharacterized protein n=1 Tax=Erythroxylum novogranatense TaxID=1862640 RepID=A0AAV8SWC5_9ROSI|nr:hypothetical protein K2173_025120 [Erythroxylum novogranatense]
MNIPSTYQPSPIPNVPMLTLSPCALISNYEIWRQDMEAYLRKQGLLEIVVPTSVPKDNEAWRKKNDKALNTIRRTCDKGTLSQINEICSAKIAWETLARMYELQTQGVNLADPSWIASFNFNFGDLSGLSKPPLVRIVRRGTVVRCHFDVDNKRFSRMYAAIYRGNGKDLKAELEADPTALTAKVSYRGHMLIHLAALAGHEHVTEELAELMNRSDLEVQDSIGGTALTYASGNGMTKTIERLLSLNDRLLFIPDHRGLLPIFGASTKPHYQTTRYLYSRFPISCFYPQSGHNGSTLLCNCIISGLLDVALDLIRRCPDLTISQDYSNRSPFLVLGKKATEFHSSNLKFWKRWIYALIHIQVPETANDEFRIQGSQLSQISPGSRKAPGGGLVWFILKLPGMKDI